MTSAFLSMLPVAVGIVISPLAVVAVILMLLSPGGRGNGLAYLGGWVVGIVLVGGVTLLLAEEQHVGAEDETALWALLVRAGLGVGLLCLGWRSWAKRPRKGEEPQLPGWMAAVQAFTPGRSFAVAALLSALKPKNLLLIVAGVLDLAFAGLGTWETATLFVVFVVLGSAGIGAPVVYAWVGGERALARLTGWRTWLVAHNAVVLAAVLAVLGVKVLSEGLKGLVA